MNICEMRANAEALGEETATGALSVKFGLFRTRNLTPIFSKTMINRAKPFSTMKTTFQGEQVGFIAF